MLSKTAIDGFTRAFLNKLVDTAIMHTIVSYISCGIKISINVFTNEHRARHNDPTNPYRRKTV